jgi:hypothetical protein
MQTVWNRHIDDYIAKGHDPRSKEEIERAAKIRSGSGALFRVCEGSECTKAESSEVKFSVCAKCKTVRAAFHPVKLCCNNNNFSEGLLL